MKVQCRENTYLYVQYAQTTILQMKIIGTGIVKG